MDRLDVMIFRSLFQGESPGPLSMDPRRSFRGIARKLGIDELTVRNRLRRLNRMGFLKGWRLFANPALLGVDLVQVLVDTRSSPREELIESLRESPAIIAVVEHLGKSMWVAFVCESKESCDREVKLIEELAGAKSSALLSARFPNCDLRLSRTDVDMIKSFSRDPRKLYADAAKELGFSSRTVRRRLERMVEGNAFFVIPSMDPSALEGALFADLLVEYSGTQKGVTVNQEIVSRLDDFLVRSQLGDPGYGFFNLFVTKLSAVNEILRSIRSIEGVKSARIDLVQERLEFFDHYFGFIGKLETLVKPQRGR